MSGVLDYYKAAKAEGIKPIQVEAFLVTLLVLLGTQEAWAVHMPAPAKTPQA